MIAKQTLVDLGMVLLVPVVLVGGYYAFGGPTDDALLTEATPSVIGPNEPGAKTKLALDTLNGISFDDSLFKDEAFTSLASFTVDIPEVPLTRDYPFTPPREISERLRLSKTGTVISKPTSVTSSKTTSSPSAKIDSIRISTSGK